LAWTALRKAGSVDGELRRYDHRGLVVSARRCADGVIDLLQRFDGEVGDGAVRRDVQHDYPFNLRVVLSLEARHMSSPFANFEV
jgi:hypothetical protein